MVTSREAEYIREEAYVPEHVIPLMAGISGAEPFFREDLLFFLKEDWMILVGYPLGRGFQEEAFTRSLEKIRKEFQPDTIWFIAPQIPEGLLPRVGEREADEYFRLDLRQSGGRRRLLREAEKAALVLRVERHRRWYPEHASLTRAFLERRDLSPRVRELYLRMPGLLARSETSLVLSAFDAGGNLSAFFVIETGARRFTVYVVGCYSQDPYVAHASDLLFREMIRLSREQSKEAIHLGLGVNEGIRRFKKKWGGVPDLPYFAGRIATREKTALSWLAALGARP